MKTMVKALVDGKWKQAWLTDERAESSYGQPVVVVEGEDCARGPAEVEMLRVTRIQDRYWAKITGIAVLNEPTLCLASVGLFDEEIWDQIWRYL